MCSQSAFIIIILDIHLVSCEFALRPYIQIISLITKAKVRNRASKQHNTYIKWENSQRNGYLSKEFLSMLLFFYNILKTLTVAVLLFPLCGAHSSFFMFFLFWFQWTFVAHHEFWFSVHMKTMLELRLLMFLYFPGMFTNSTFVKNRIHV